MYVDISFAFLFLYLLINLDMVNTNLSQENAFPLRPEYFLSLNQLHCMSYNVQSLWFHGLHFLSLLAVRSRTILQLPEDYNEELPDTTQFSLNSSDYLKAASPLPSQNMPSLGEVTLEVSEIERKSQENKIKTQKR